MGGWGRRLVLGMCKESVVLSGLRMPKGPSPLTGLSWCVQLVSVKLYMNGPHKFMLPFIWNEPCEHSMRTAMPAAAAAAATQHLLNRSIHCHRRLTILTLATLSLAVMVYSAIDLTGLPAAYVACKMVTLSCLSKYKTAIISKMKIVSEKKTSAYSIAALTHGKCPSKHFISN